MANLKIDEYNKKIKKDFESQYGDFFDIDFLSGGKIKENIFYILYIDENATIEVIKEHLCKMSVWYSYWAFQYKQSLAQLQLLKNEYNIWRGQMYFSMRALLLDDGFKPSQINNTVIDNKLYFEEEGKVRDWGKKINMQEKVCEHLKIIVKALECKKDLLPTIYSAEKHDLKNY